jgi:5-oxoprolinase (ATP-hydrolysing) subunit A
MPTIDLNCDLGEDPAMLARDLELLNLVTSANIACGGHAGDEGTMRAMVRAAAARGCGIGAHPSYPDRANFGRREMAIGEADLEESVAGQIAALARIALAHSARLTHVKPHGALYHGANHRPAVAAAIARAAARVDPALILVAQSGSAAVSAYGDAGLGTISEAFADRRYEPDGALRSRALPGALIADPARAAEQAVRIARGEGVIAPDGSVVALRAETICIHSDTRGAVDNAREIRRKLETAGVRVAPLAI